MYKLHVEDVASSEAQFPRMVLVKVDSKKSWDLYCLIFLQLHRQVVATVNHGLSGIAPSCMQSVPRFRLPCRPYLRLLATKRRSRCIRSPRDSVKALVAILLFTSISARSSVSEHERTELTPHRFPRLSKVPLKMIDYLGYSRSPPGIL
jgi:hypothetical protein